MRATECSELPRRNSSTQRSLAVQILKFATLQHRWSFVRVCRTMSVNIRRIVVAGVVVVSAAVLLWLANAWRIGRSLGEYRNVQIFDNGFLYFRSYGTHSSSDGYYFGQKWQCVEFVKRFYFEAYAHRMPDVWGHAKEFFDPKVTHGMLNSRRGMIQYTNGGNEPPAPDDLLVFTDTEFGHVAIVSAVSGNSIEVVQQNIVGQPRQTFALKRSDDSYRISSPRSPIGWLRVSAAPAP